jgi:hypothetical protein
VGCSEKLGNHVSALLLSHAGSLPRISRNDTNFWFFRENSWQRLSSYVSATNQEAIRKKRIDPPDLQACHMRKGLKNWGGLRI